MEVFAVFFLIFAFIALFFIVVQWKIYSKAGKPGWAAFIPIYNIIVMLDIVGKPLSWFIFLIIPGVNVVFAILLTNLLAKSFGKGTGYTLGLLFLPLIFYPMLALGSAQYQGPAGLNK